MKLTAVLVSIGFIAGACSPATEITASWKNPNHQPQSVQKILVAALNGNSAARQAIENDFSRALEQNGYATIKGQDILPPALVKGEPDKEALLDSIGGKDIDAILTIALINDQSENQYVASQPPYDPIPRFRYYRSFWGYYHNWYPPVEKTSSFIDDVHYFFETNLYDAETDELLWSAQSATHIPGDVASVARDFASVVISRMEDEQVITND